MANSVHLSVGKYIEFGQERLKKGVIMSAERESLQVSIKNLQNGTLPSLSFPHVKMRTKTRGRPFNKRRQAH